MAMSIHTKAPDIPNPAWPKGGYPTKGRKLGPAWEAVWAELVRAASSPDPSLDAHALAEVIAPEHGLAPATLVGVISRAAKVGLLQRELRPVTGKRGIRTRTFYRIPADA